jgi:diguanylate cyclase (GGDEF)-like protein
MDEFEAGVLIVDEKSRKLEFCNNKFGKMWNIPDQIMKRGDDREMIAHVLKQLVEPSKFLKSIENIHKSNLSLSDELEFIDGRIYSRKSLSVTDFNDSRFRAWIFTDITKEKSFTIDSLTGCFSRKAWDDLHVYDSKALSSSSYCVVVVDLNDFHVVNNDFGHDAGDRVLIRLGEAMRRIFSKIDDRVYRLGGDDFCALVKSDSDISNDIYNKLSNELMVSGVNAAIGVCMSTSEYGILEAYRTADKNMQHSKKREKENRIGLHPGLPLFRRVIKTDEEIRMLADLSVAIEKNEIYIVFQPIFDRFNEIKFIEVFCRWANLEKEISPSIFIPLAESTNLIHRVWDHVLTSAVKTIADWKDAGKIVKPLSLNFSAVQVEYYKNTGFSYPDQIRNVCDEYGISPSNLKIELTETSLLQHLNEAQLLFNQLNDLGVSLCIDDYGTGYSSLSIIQALPIKCLKLDGSFVKGIPFNSENTAIAKGTILMANELGLEVCAECVEDIDQINILAEYGCQYFQGYFKCPPISSDEMTKIL